LAEEIAREKISLLPLNKPIKIENLVIPEIKDLFIIKNRNYGESGN